MFKVERDGVEIQQFETEQDWLAWMQHHAIRKSSGEERQPDVGIDEDGKRWTQVGYVLVPE